MIVESLTTAGSVRRGQPWVKGRGLRGTFRGLTLQAVNEDRPILPGLWWREATPAERRGLIFEAIAYVVLAAILGGALLFARGRGWL